MLRARNIFRNYSLPILLISLLFFLKALYLAFCVTPFSAVPDEIGHFAYVQDIASGKGIPALSTLAIGKSLIGADIMEYVEKNTNAKPAYNWIAQHPPVYYALAAIPLKIGSWFTDDPEILFRLPRIISALSGALLLLVLFRTFRVIGLDAPRSTAIAAAIGFIPMVSHLSSGTNHDITLFLFCALATYFFSRYIIHRTIKDTYWCAIWLAIAGGTKMMTPWVLIAPIVFFMILELPVSNRIKHSIGIMLTALSVPIVWMIRNIINFGSPLYTSGSERIPGISTPLDISFFDFIRTQPAINQIINWFYGMFVYLGAGQKNIILQNDVTSRNLNFSWFTIHGFPYKTFLIILSILSCICLIYIFKLVWRVSENKITQSCNNSFIFSWNSALRNSIFLYPLLAIGMLAASCLSIHIYTISFNNLDYFLFFSVPASIFLGILSVPLIFCITENIDRIALYGFATTLFFGTIFIYHIYGAYLIEGQLRATQGRYFYPVIPFILLSMAIVFMRLRIPVAIINSVVAILACMELFSYLEQIIPFYLKQYS